MQQGACHGARLPALAELTCRFIVCDSRCSVMFTSRSPYTTLIARQHAQQTWGCAAGPGAGEGLPNGGLAAIAAHARHPSAASSGSWRRQHCPPGAHALRLLERHLELPACRHSRRQLLLSTHAQRSCRVLQQQHAVLGRVAAAGGKRLEPVRLD